MNTSSFSFPNIFDVARNKVSTKEDSESITSRIRLMMLTEPSELYGNPNYGLGLRRYIFQYNSDNVIPQIRERLVEQLRLWEPSVDPESTVVTRGLLDESNPGVQGNNLDLTVSVKTVYGNTLSIEISTTLQ